ncbi:meiosis-specific nuclear structural protein 1-like isoform X2 [Lycorma delicatula]
MEHNKQLDAVYYETNKMDIRAQRCARIRQQLKNEAAKIDASLPRSKGREEMEFQAHRLAQQEKLAAELANIKREEFVELKLRQQMRETDIELRELANKLRTAYINKDLAAQLEERKLAELYQKMEEDKAAELTRKIIQKNQEDLAREAGEEYVKKLQYRKDLQEQMCDKVCKREKSFEQFLRDKCLLDEVTRIIHEEDMREEEMKMIQMRKTKEEMDYFLKAREEWRRRERERTEEEDRKLIQYWIEKDARDQQLAMEEKCLKETFEKRKNIVIEFIKEAQKRQENERNVLEQLSIEERIAKDERRFRTEMENAVKRKMELKYAYDEQRRERLEQLRRESEMDEQYRQQFLMKFAEDERIEQMTKQRRRQKIIEHKKAVDEMMVERQRRRAEEAFALKAMEEYEEQQIKLRHKMVEEERLRMLQEHAKYVLGYLPKGVLKPLDLPHIGSALIKENIL